MVGDECFNLSWKMFVKFFCCPWAVKKECTTIYKFLNHVVFVDVWRVVACNKVCFMNQVSRFDRFLTETEVRHCNTTGFLWIIIKVSLCIHICVITDDLDRVLVSSDCSVSSKSPELTVDCSFWCCNQWSTNFKRKSCYIINDTDCEFSFCFVLEYSNNLSRCCIFRTKSVTSRVDLNSVEFSSFKSCNDIKVQRFSKRSWFFCSVKNVDVLNSIRNCIYKCLCAEWSVKTNFNNTNLLALSK